MRNERKTGGGGADKTPLGFLTWLVRNGHLRDCARALIKYGVKPALGSPTRASMQVFKQYFELHNDHDMRTDEKPPTKILELYNTINGAIKISSAVNSGDDSEKVPTAVKNKYSATGTQERNLFVDPLTKHGAPMLPKLMMVLHAYLAQNIFSKSRKERPFVVPLIKVPYLGFPNGAPTDRFQFIRLEFDGGGTWLLNMFDRNEGDSDPRTMEQLCMAVHDDKVRSSLPAAKQETAKNEAKAFRMRLNGYVIANNWTMNAVEEYEGTEGKPAARTERGATQKLRQERIDNAYKSFQTVAFLMRDSKLVNMPEQFHPWWDRAMGNFEALRMETAEGRSESKKVGTPVKDDPDDIFGEAGMSEDADGQHSPEDDASTKITLPGSGAIVSIPKRLGHAVTQDIIDAIEAASPAEKNNNSGRQMDDVCPADEVVRTVNTWLDEEDMDLCCQIDGLSVKLSLTEGRASAIKELLAPREIGMPDEPVFDRIRSNWSMVSEIVDEDENVVITLERIESPGRDLSKTMEAVINVEGPGILPITEPDDGNVLMRDNVETCKSEEGGAVSPAQDVDNRKRSATKDLIGEQIKIQLRRCVT